MILIDVALMLLAPEVAEAVNMGAGSHFTLATEAVPRFEPISGLEAVLSSSENRRRSRQTTQAASFQPADNLRPTKLAENSAMLEWRFACVIGKRAGQRPLATIIEGPEMLNKPLVLTPSICNPAAVRYGLLGAETPRWRGTDWIVGGMTIAVILLATLLERYSPGAGT
ncbi:hypothetical protein [Bradyrhizobium ivorense]|uniref:hypothetical protein n=1 Tax=Bradyrhizobium ivorense TaxID=2511166 RepID=UPI001E59A6E0|nr:hypothetical protein [Bradyrhizobium ivorense]